MKAVTIFDLERRMSDAKASAKLVAGLLQEVFVDRRFWPDKDKVHCERCLRGAHAPDVQIVNVGDTGKIAKKGFDLLLVDSGRDGIQ